jgi:GDSL/SGNH-like Acyl-Esterase family found in Pmr5 and Cas1p
LTLEDYQRQQQQAHQAITSTSSIDDLCDACRMVHLLQQHNLSFAFFGDSLTSSKAQAFVCELQRRNFSVTLQEEPIPADKRGDGYRNFREIHHFSIHSPLWQDNTTSVKVDFIFQWRLPFLFPDQQEAIVSNYDVLMINFGHHFVYQPNPNDKWERERFNRHTLPILLTDFFNAIYKANRTKLVAWRETTASHFDANVGEYSLARAAIPGFMTGNSTCVAHFDHTVNQSMYAWREKEGFQKAIQQTNFTMVTAGQHMPPHDKKKSEMVVIPFYDFSSQNHAFHRQVQSGKPPDCVHFCYSPFLYLPIWRGIRLAMERSFPILV